MSMRNITSHFSTKETPQSQPIPGTKQVENSAGGFTWAVDKWTRLNRFLILGAEGGSYYAAERKLTADNAKSALDCIQEDGVRVVRTIVEVSDQGRAPKNDPAIFLLAMCAKLGNPETIREAYLALPKVCRIGTHLFQWATAIEAFGGFASGTQRAITRWYLEPRQVVMPADPDEDGPINKTLSDEERAQATTDIQNSHVRWLALQAVKYQAREGWSHRDMINLARMGSRWNKAGDQNRTPEVNAVLDWITGKVTYVDGAWHRMEKYLADPSNPRTEKWKVGAVHEDSDRIPGLITGFEKAKAVGNAGDVSKAHTKEIVGLINEFGLPREAIPTAYLNEVEVWAALLDNRGYGMPMTAMIRNLPKMTSIGLLKPMSSEVGLVLKALGNRDTIKRARVHPLSVLVALNTYKGGQGIRGSLTWSPVSQIVDALDKAFYLSFDAVEPTGKRHLLALDISGSMGSPNLANLPGITPRIGSAAMALVTAAVEPQHHIVGFTCQDSTTSWNYGRKAPAGLNQFWSAPSGSKCGQWGGTASGLSVLDISPRQRLDDVVNYVGSLPMGGTDCAVPMLYAMDRGLEVDVFVVYTDSETWASEKCHPIQALDMYKRKSGIDAKMVIVGMVGNEFTIADPNRKDNMDIVGFDTTAPAIMAEFVRGNI